MVGGVSQATDQELELDQIQRDLEELPRSYVPTHGFTSTLTHPGVVRVWSVGEYAKLMEGMFFLEHWTTLCADCYTNLVFAEHMLQTLIKANQMLISGMSGQFNRVMRRNEQERDLEEEEMGNSTEQLLEEETREEE